MRAGLVFLSAVVLIACSGVSSVLASPLSAETGKNINGAGQPHLVCPQKKLSTPLDVSSKSAYDGQTPSLNRPSLINPVDLLNGFFLRADGAAAYDLAGYAVSNAGDVNGDHLDDLIVGAPDAANSGGSNSGAAYVVFGRAMSGILDLGSLGVGGFAIYGAAASDDAGISVSRAGDVNGDGLGDLIVGARYAGNGGRVFSGSAYVVWGQATQEPVDLSSLTGKGFRIDGAWDYGHTGRSVSAAGDVNDDGLDDLVVGAPENDNNLRIDSGTAYVIWGKCSDTTVDLARIVSLEQGFPIYGAAVSDFAGQSVSAVGDLNNDGKDEVVVGAYGADNNGRDGSGSAYLIFGKSSIDPVDLIDLGPSGYRIDGASGYHKAGYSVAGTGDVNEDGLNDLIVGADGASYNRRPGSGSAYVLFGKTSTEPVDLANPGFGGFRIDGAKFSDHAGSTVSGAGDVNGDGLADVVLGAEWADNNGRPVSGSAFTVFGKRDTAPVDLAAFSNGFRIDGARPNDQAGHSVSGGGDVDGDGLSDPLVGAIYPSNNGRSFSGSAYVVTGRAASP